MKPAIPSRSQSRANLSGMMAVIVNHAHAPHPAFQLEAAVHTAKILQAFADALRIKIQPHTHTHRRRGVQDIVVPGTCR